MPLFDRSPPPQPAHDRHLHQTLDSLRSSIDHIQQRLQQPSAPASGHLTPAPSARDWGSAAVAAVGLAVLAGTVLYASRRPRLPQGIAPVEHLELPRYMGKWYTLAQTASRLDQDLQRTQAEYTLTPSGSIQVIHRSYHPQHGEWKISRGKIQLPQASDIAAWKISFWGPFYDGYNVVALDENYRWAMVIGASLKDFRILSRTPTLPEDVTNRLLHQAHLLGVDVQRVHWVHQDGVNPTGRYHTKNDLR